MSHPDSQLRTRREFVTAALTTVGAAAMPRLVWAQKTEKVATKPIRIALICDTHTTRGIQNDQPQHKARFDRVIAAVNASKPDWILHGGDLTEGAKPEEIEDFKEQVRALKAPMDWVYGNHDVGAKRVEGQKSGLSMQRVERIETTLGPSFWEKTRGGLRVVAANTSLFNSGLTRETEQWEFLENALHAPASTPTLFLGHYPPFIEKPEELEDPYWNIAPQPRTRLLALMKRGGVKAMLSGHLHRPLKLQYEGVPLVVGPAVSFGLPRESQIIGWTEINITGQGEFTAEWRAVEK
jgi:3',5'-cyclic AMP phosphodiesterase CpdA